MKSEVKVAEWTDLGPRTQGITHGRIPWFDFYFLRFASYIPAASNLPNNTCSL